MILQLCRNVDFKAVTLVIDDQLLDVSEIPFPAVTIFNRFSYKYQFWMPDELYDSLEYVEDTGSPFILNLSQFKPPENPTARYKKAFLLPSIEFNDFFD